MFENRLFLAYNNNPPIIIDDAARASIRHLRTCRTNVHHECFQLLLNTRSNQRKKIQIKLITYLNRDNSTTAFKTIEKTIPRIFGIIILTQPQQGARASLATSTAEASILQDAILSTERERERSAHPLYPKTEFSGIHKIYTIRGLGKARLDAAHPIALHILYRAGESSVAGIYPIFLYRKKNIRSQPGTHQPRTFARTSRRSGQHYRFYV